MAERADFSIKNMGAHRNYLDIKHFFSKIKALRVMAALLTSLFDFVKIIK